ncbi:MAG: VWA domain-containing protein [Deltaproteobacteria bacterium]|nr:MAG: VWA domain-containing protein [Deltaproteobacteria bacterium]
MRFATLFTALALMSALPSVASARSGAPEGDLDRSQSPYFVVKGAKPGVDTMPLESTRADVAIAGTIAKVRVTQVYKNSGDDVLEAIYVFPGSTRAAVFGMRMTVGDRTIVAQIQKKDDARKMYEDAKAAGKSASLLEQQRPNVFQMNVANILPGDRIQVELDYTELLVPTNGTYEFVYPAVVGPRYTGEDTSDQKWTAQPYSHEGEAPSYQWDMAVRLAAGMPIQRVTSDSHKITTKLSALRDVADVTLTSSPDAGTKDFVLRYQLSGKAIQSGLLLYPGQGDEPGYFLAMVQPPQTVGPREMPKREYVFVLDVSGSMHGFPLDTAKSVMEGLFKGLRPEDRFNIVFFSGGSAVLANESLLATKANMEAARAMLAKMRGGGGTQLLGALNTAFALPTAQDYSRTFVVVTDGYVSVEPQAFELIRKSLDKANLFAFGIGSSVNRHLIEGMARVGQGEPFFVMNGDDAAEKSAAFTRYIEAPALTRVKVAFDGFDAFDIEPAASPDLFAARPVVVFGKYKGAPRGKITVSGLTGGGRWSQTLDVAAATPATENLALRYLWARARVATLGDLNNLRNDDKRVQEITEIGLKYGLMTAYTSFIAVDEKVRNAGGKTTTVQQPLPLPSGVSDLAVGGAASGYGGAMMRSKRAVRAPMMVREEAAADAPEPSPKTTAHATGRASVVSVKGGLERGIVARIFRAHLRGLVRAAGWHGQVDLFVSIDAKGRVTAVKVASGTIPKEALARVTSEIQRWTFPAADKATETRVSLTL